MTKYKHVELSNVGNNILIPPIKNWASKNSSFFVFVIFFNGIFFKLNFIETLKEKGINNLLYCLQVSN